MKPLKGSYGDNLKRARDRLSERLGHKVTQEEIARRQGTKRQGNLSSRENKPDIPLPQTVIRDAEALECPTWVLLEGLEFPHDRLRMHPETLRHTTREDALSMMDRQLEREEHDAVASKPSTTKRRVTKVGSIRLQRGK